MGRVKNTEVLHRVKEERNIIQNKIKKAWLDGRSYVA